MSLGNHNSVTSTKSKTVKPIVNTTQSVNTTMRPTTNTPNTPVRHTKYGTTGASNGTTINSPYSEPDSPIASISKRATKTPTVQQNSSRTPSRANPAMGANTTAATSSTTRTPAHAPKPQATSSPHLFSPKYGDESRHTREHTSSKQTSSSASQDLASAIVPGKLGSPRAILQKRPVHTYNPPCMQGVYKALNHKNANNQIILSNLAAFMEDDSFPDEDEFDPFYFIKSLPPLNPTNTPPRKSPIPPKAADTPLVTLALDLDETLVHCSIQPIESPDFVFHVNFNGLDYEVFVRIRPHLEYFLKQVSQWFEVVVFTASQKVYADSLLNIIDPMNEYITHRVFRDSCVCVDGNYLKDLNILGRPLDKVVIVDNSFQAFGFQLDNGIPIESWFDDENDSELLHLVPFLRHLKDAQDLRPYVRDTFRLQEFVDCLVNPYE